MPSTPGREKGRRASARARGATSPGSPPSPRSSVPFDWRPAAIVTGCVLLVTSVFLYQERRIAGVWGYSLDDSWIYATMARNLATGQGFAFNPGEPVSGSTGPLYTFVLAFLYFLFRDVVWTAKGFGILCQIGSAIAIHAAVRHALPGARGIPLAAGILMGTAPALVWGSLSGMEIPFYVLLVSIGILFHVRGRTLLAVLVWSLGVWLRPDGLFLVALAVAFGNPRDLPKRALVAAPVVLAYFGFNAAIGGSWMPQTVGAKAHFGIDLVHRTWNMMREWGALWGVPYRRTDQLEEPIVFLALLLIGAVLTLRRKPLLAAYVIGFPIAMSLFRDHSASHKRYILYVIPFAMLLSVMAVDFLSRKWAQSRQEWVAPVVLALCLVWQATLVPPKAEVYAWNVQNINKMQVLLGKFVKLVTQPGDRVATNDIGAIGYFGERYVVDLMGLITPQGTLKENLEEYQPKLLLVFLTWFRTDAVPDPKSGNYLFFDADSSHRYELLAGIELRKNTICANNRMTAYVRLGPDDPSPTQRFLYYF